MKEGMLRKVVKGVIILLSLLLATAPVIFAQEETPVPNSEYYNVETQELPNGASIDRVVINGPPDPPPGFEADRAVAPGAVAAAGTLPVPAFDWSYGCSATSAAMIAAYYDRTDYPNMYTGPTNGGVMPMDNSSWGNTTYTDCPGPDTTTVWECPLSATHNGVDGRVTNGHVDDYWQGYGCPGPDPWDGNWPEHTHGDCTADYMNTNQWVDPPNFNTDGGTTFYYYTSGSATPTSVLLAAGPPYSYDGGLGFHQFLESRGYTVVNAYNQYILGYENPPYPPTADGFTYDDYKAEIDAGRPVMIHVEGHTMVGVGYDDTSSDLMYVNNTWDFLSGVHTMIWGGSYSGMAHVGVTVVQLEPVVYNSQNTGSWDTNSTWDVGHVPGPSGIVTISAGDTVTLSDNSAAMTLTVESGATLDLDGYDLTVGGAVINNGTMIQTLDVPNSATTEFLHIQNFGDSADKYFGVDILPTSGDMDSTTVAVQGNQTCPSGSSTVMRCFEITPGTLRTATVTFYYRDAEENGQDAAQIWHWTGSSWEQETFDSRDRTGVENNWVRVTGVDAYSPFAAANDNPTAVTLASFEAVPSGAAVLVTWETAMEIETVGFNVWRSTAHDGGYVQVNDALIPSQSPGAPFGAEYAWLDESVESGVVYYYKLEDIEDGDVSTFHGPISVSQGPNAISVTVLNAEGAPLAIGLVVGSLLLGGIGLALARRARRRD